LRNTAVDVESKKQELGIPRDAKVLFSVGELNDNKNHIVILNALSKVRNLPDNLYYLICGKGDNLEKLKEHADAMGLGNRVVLAGFRYDVQQIFYTADYFAFPSFHEGLPVSVMDAMTIGLPIVASRIRGNVDLIKDGEGGYLFDPTDVDGFADGLSKLFAEKQLCKRMGENNKKNVMVCDISSVQKEMFNIYSNLLK
jgi:glycosyltransferase involved in cell wall biosynthesis